MTTEMKKISLFEKLIYGSGDVGLNAMYTLFSSYVLMFYTDVLMINAALIGTVIMISKIFDGISDLIAGQLIDKHKNKYGHCIPVLMKWAIPMVLSVILVFTVPDGSVGLRVAYIFITYNLFNTILYTYVGMAHGSLASYVTNDSKDRSQMLIFKMMFAAATQTIMASVMIPMVEHFGGQQMQSAWIKAIMVFGVIGLIPIALNVFFVKERVENDTPAENLLIGVKCAVVNKYWWMAFVVNLMANFILTFNLSVSLYYLKDVVGNIALMGTFVACSNLPGVIISAVAPFLLNKFTKQQMVIFGAGCMLAAQIAFIFMPFTTTMLFLTALLRGIGMGFAMGMAGALIGDTIDYGEWKTGVRVQSVLFSAASVGAKVGQGALTAAFGFVLSAIAYDGSLAVQAAGTISGIDAFFKFGPLVVAIILLIDILMLDVEKKNPQFIREIAERKAGKKA